VQESIKVGVPVRVHWLFIPQLEVQFGTLTVFRIPWGCKLLLLVLPQFEVQTWALTLVMIGLLFVYSATSTETVVYSVFLQKQFFGVLSGLLLYFLFCFSDYRITSQLGYFAYFAVVLLLIYTLLRGKIGMGAQRWIDLGFVRFQASEVAKLFFPAFFTHYLYTEKDVPVYTFSTFMPILTILVVSCLLILKQPDLGTCLLVFFSGLVLLWLVGINKNFFKRHSY
jgi:rod shape determining protein RodA